MYSSVFPKNDPRAAERFSDHVFRVYDWNGDGRVSFKEFIATLQLRAGHGSTDDKLRAAFRLFDVDHNGFITKHELDKILTVC